jgi:hypothetical protein
MSLEQTNIALPDLPGIEQGWEILTVDQDRQAGKFTAAHLAGNLAKRDAVVRALGEGMSIARVARAFGMSRNTVAVAARRFGPDIEHRKKETGALCFDVARMAVERIRDEMDDMPKASLPIIAGVLIDKGQLLSGAPTARVEHTQALGFASFNDWLGSLVDVTPAAPVGAQETLGQKGGALEAGAIQLGCVDLGPDKRAGDEQSPAFAPAVIGAAPAVVPESGQKGGAA